MKTEENVDEKCMNRFSCGFPEVELHEKVKKFKGLFTMFSSVYTCTSQWL